VSEPDSRRRWLCLLCMLMIYVLLSAGTRRGVGRLEPSGAAHSGVVAGRQLYSLGLEKE